MVGDEGALVPKVSLLVPDPPALVCPTASVVTSKKIVKAIICKRTPELLLETLPYLRHTAIDGCFLGEERWGRPQKSQRDGREICAFTDG